MHTASLAAVRAIMIHIPVRRNLQAPPSALLSSAAGTSDYVDYSTSSDYYPTSTIDSYYTTPTDYSDITTPTSTDIYYSTHTTSDVFPYTTHTTDAPLETAAGASFGSSSHSSSSQGLSIAAIAGISVGGFVFFVILAVGIWLCCRNRPDKNRKKYKKDPIIGEKFLPDQDPVGDYDRAKM